MPRIYEKTLFFKVENARKNYYRFIFDPVTVLDRYEKFSTKEHYRSVPENVAWEQTGPGFPWGGEYVSCWVKGRYTVAEKDAGKKLFIQPSNGHVEALMFVDGKPCGIINGRDPGGDSHLVIPLTDSAVPGTIYEIAMENDAWHHIPGAFPYDNYGRDVPGEHDFDRVFENIAISTRNDDIFYFYVALRDVIMLAQELTEDNLLKYDAADTVAEIHKHLVMDPLNRPEEEWRSQIGVCNEILKQFFGSHPQTDVFGYVGVIGHSHMDTAWLWPVSDTIRKCARTYSNVVTMMRQYPEYMFVQSSALHTDWMRRYYPSIFEDIRQMAKEGRYEQNGGVWVECDCNITSGEGMVRQFLKGQRFYREYFGKTSDCFWLPDTFGYNAAIPQIMLGSEVKYFYTTKMAWNDLNKFPLDTFRWTGIDGSTVLTHLNRMCGHPTPCDIVGQAKSQMNRYDCPDRLVAFGFGDGGGGPNSLCIEEARLMTQLGGKQRVEYTSISDFMKRLDEKYPDLPVYNGELYLEKHRGTLTQAHANKRNNRKAEFALRDMEFLNVLCGEPMSEENDRLWKVVLINQFHDILPGSSIEIVNRQSREQYAELFRDVKKADLAYIEKLTKKSSAAVFALNTLSHDRKDVLSVETERAGAKGFPSQRYTDLKGRSSLLIGGVTVPAFGGVNIAVSDEPCKAASPFRYSADSLETPTLSVSFDEDGYISSLIHKASGRQVRRPGGAPLNTFYSGENVPMEWDCWDIDLDSKDTQKAEHRLVKREVASDGAVAFVIRSEYLVGVRSSLVQDMIFYADSDRIDFHTLIDWKDKHTLLKVGFDIDVMADYATHEIQFGHIERTTKSNLPTEAAQFEVCNHKWTDISDKHFGAAVLNDCKYGISVSQSDLRLSLHNGGIRPDPTGDAGLHEVTYSLLPHTGPVNAQNVALPAYELNVPAVTGEGELKNTASYLRISAGNVICEALKPSEDRPAGVVARLYETDRSRTETTVTLPAGKTRAFLTNLLEDVKEELPVQDGAVSLSFGPFEIKTILFE